MKKDSSDTSQIGITAHHTAFTWYKNGLSHPALATGRGRALFLAAAPWMWLGKNLLGITDIETYLLQRHILMDHLMDRAVEDKKPVQVLELACGLSPRGWRFLSRHKNKAVRYVETDLPGMAARKKEILNQAGLLQSAHSIAALNILAEDGPESLEQVCSKHIEAGCRTIVVTEGLINYFPLPVVEKLWQRIAAALKRQGEGIYIADNMTLPQNGLAKAVIKPFRSIIETLAGGRTHLHFADDGDAIASLSACGFDKAFVHRPEDWAKPLNLPLCRSQSTTRILEAWITR
ncbi:MAG: class I SAM-dependent methyltransferase [Desulfatibacillaceae bacterium]|nr:class I SAM-dependent methyltransferase [Desulfatibacillaceae bacterium]